MCDFKAFESMSKEQREAVILAMRPPVNATPDEQQRFELLRQVALGRKLTEAEQQAIQIGQIAKNMSRQIAGYINGYIEKRGAAN